MYLTGAKTDRLSIRALELSDIPAWEAFFDNNPALPYLGLDLSKSNQQQAKEWIEWQLKRYQENRYGHHALLYKQNNEFIGQCGLLTQEIEGKKEIEIGYHILPKFWGKGFATEAAKKFRDYAFENKISHSLISVIDIRNEASQNVAKKMGMKVDKQIKYFDLDVFIYRLNLNLS